jgi:hypothetical protein
MKVAIEFRRVGSAFRRETVALTRHSQRKAQRLLSKRRLESGPESRSGDLKQRKPDSASFSEAIRLAQQGDAAAFEFIYKHWIWFRKCSYSYSARITARLCASTGYNAKHTGNKWLLLKYQGRSAYSLPFEVDCHLDPISDLDERNATVHTVVLAVEGHRPFNLA